jgi:hypothetical protein
MASFGYPDLPQNVLRHDQVASLGFCDIIEQPTTPSDRQHQEQ